MEGICCCLFYNKNVISSPVSNCRPISIPGTFSKIYEFVTHGHVSNNLRSNFNLCQRGFIKSKPTATSLAIYFDHITRLIYSQRQVDAICFRFSNASGTVIQEPLCQHSVTAGCLHNLLPKLFDQQNIRCPSLWSAFFAICNVTWCATTTVTGAHLLSICVGAVR